MISTLGFPIVCVVGLAFFIWKVWTHYRDDMNANMERLQARCIEREKVLTKTIQENQKVVEFYETNISDIKADVNEIKEIVLKQD